MLKQTKARWTARKRERAAGRLCPAAELPTQAKTGLEGNRPPVQLLMLPGGTGTAAQALRRLLGVTSGAKEAE